MVHGINYLRFQTAAMGLAPMVWRLGSVYQFDYNDARRSSTGSKSYQQKMEDYRCGAIKEYAACMNVLRSAEYS